MSLTSLIVFIFHYPAWFGFGLGIAGVLLGLAVQHYKPGRWRSEWAGEILFIATFGGLILLGLGDAAYDRVLIGTLLGILATLLVLGVLLRPLRRLAP